MNVRSLDDEFYFHAGNPKLRIVTENHTSITIQELELLKDDIIILNNHQVRGVGYMWGTNRRNSRSGLFPVFKTKPIYGTFRSDGHK